MRRRAEEAAFDKGLLLRHESLAVELGFTVVMVFSGDVAEWLKAAVC